MRLTLVTETFAPEINGVSMTLGRLVDGLSRRGIEVAVIAPARKDRLNLPQGGHTLFMVPGLPIPRYPELRFGLPAAGRLADWWHEAPPDLVHIATEGPLGWSALHAASRLHIPVVSSFHTNFHSYGSHYGYGFVQAAVLGWLRHFHNRTLRTFAPAADVILKLQQAGFENLRLMPRGVDNKLFGPHRRDAGLRRSWGADDNTPVAVHVGRLAHEKNPELVIQAWQRMRSTLPDIKLVLVGDGPALRSIKAAHPQVILAGMQRGEVLAAHYASADCFLFASTTETFGNVVTEAMASGLPVLAYAYAAPGQFIESGRTGFLAPFADPAAFLDGAAALAALRPAWAAMGAQARTRVLPLSWDHIVEAYLEEIQSLAAPAKRRSA